MKLTTVAAAAVAAVTMLAVAGCGSIAKTSAPAHSTPAAPPGSAPSSAAAAAQQNDLSGPVGTTYAVTDASGDKISVTLTQVIDPAPGADQFTTPQSGDRFVGAVFTIKGLSGTFSDDANDDATVIGSNGQTYSADFDSIARYTNFNNGEYNVSGGESSVGAVTFQVPLTVTVAKIEWSANDGLTGAPGEWLIPARASAATAASAAADPWNVVSGYFQDVSQGDYTAAWNLLGPGLQAGGYASFAAGYADTGQQTLTKTSQSGDQVSFSLTSDNHDGTVQTYHGTDTVTGGKIVAAHVVQTS